VAAPPKHITDPDAVVRRPEGSLGNEDDGAVAVVADDLTAYFSPPGLRGELDSKWFPAMAAGTAAIDRKLEVNRCSSTKRRLDPDGAAGELDPLGERSETEMPRARAQRLDGIKPYAVVPHANTVFAVAFCKRDLDA
jgi:hypothetical protein